MNKTYRIVLLGISTALSGCSLAPEFKMPEVKLPAMFKEQPPVGPASEVVVQKGSWKAAESLEKTDRGPWWTIFGDARLNELEEKAMAANPSLKMAAARVEESRALANANTISFFPDIGIGANAVRAKPASAGVAAFGGNPNAQLKPYTLYSAQGVASYEADLFGRVRDNYKSYEADAQAEAAAYRSALLALQADVAQHYYTLRTLDADHKLLRETLGIREEAQRIMQKRFDQGDVGEQDLSRTQSELSGTRANLLAVERQRAAAEHALAVLIGELPANFMLAEAPLSDADMPPLIPAGLPSSLLERRPDIAAAQAAMAAANARIGVARTAFFPRLILTASGGFESTDVGDLFKWSSRTWALGQLADTALSMPIFDNGRNQARLDQAHAAYDEALNRYREQVLVAFRDVEDSLSDQRLLAEQSAQQDIVAQATSRTTDLTRKRYEQGDVNYFEVVNAERDSLAADRAAVEARGQRMITTVSLIRALGGGWDSKAPETSKAETQTK